MRPDRMVRRTVTIPGDTTERFIETDPTIPGLWESRLAAWKADHRLPCPMVKGHMMFRIPRAYNVTPINYAARPGM